MAATKNSCEGVEMAIRNEHQRWDYIGNLRSNLGNLSGHSTLAFELLQNADDAPNVTELTFDVGVSGLSVRNNGKFRKIDFDRMTKLGGGGKRHENDTTGSFGIGLISLYLICDHPTLISSGQRWTFYPEQDGRIEIDDSVVERDGTEFLLPWADNATSPVRTELGIPPVPHDIGNLFLGELRRVLPQAMLFLRKVKTLRLQRDGHPYVEIKKEGETNQVYVQVSETGKEPDGRLWHLLQGDFAEEEARLRVQFPGFIEPKRRSLVQLAIPERAIEIEGLFCATLPTQQPTGFPIHLNGHFYPSTDRKRLRFEEGPQEYTAQWNRAGVRAAASLLGDALADVLSSVGDYDFWFTLERIKFVHDSNRGRDTDLHHFWQAVKAQIPSSPFLRTTSKKYAAPIRTVLVAVENAEDYFGVLEDLGINVVAPQLVCFSDLLRSPEVGVIELTALRLASEVIAQGLNRAMEIQEAPLWLQLEENRQLLGWLAESLLQTTKQGPDRVAAKDAIAQCAIALGADGRLYPLKDLYDATKDEVKLFSRLKDGLPFLMHGQAEVFRDLAQPFNVTAALALLESIPAADIEGSWKRDRTVIHDLISFFELEQAQLVRVVSLRDRFFALPLFPSGGALRSLTGLLVPGNFQDPLNSSSILDLKACGGHREFLSKLDAPRLDFITYVRERIPALLRSGTTVELAGKRQLLELLAVERLRLIDKEDIRQTLMTTPVVQCENGDFYTPVEAYFRSKSVVTILGPTISLAREDGRAIRELYEWLGVVDEPRGRDLVKRVKALVDKPPQPESRMAVQMIFDHLARRWEQEASTLEPLLSDLQKIPWLPARFDDTHWHQPEKLYATYQFQLFSTQARFLDAQNQQRDLIEFLGVNTAPSTRQVVDHVLACASKGEKVHPDVYMYLNRNRGEAEILRLRGQYWIPVSSGRFVRPDYVFWGEHPFGSYRFKLPQELFGFVELLKRLGSKEIPGAGDAKAVLLEISESFGPQNRVLDSATRFVVMECWRIFGERLEAGDLPAQGLADLFDKKVIPDDRNLLNPTRDMFLGDRPTLASEFGSFLRHNVIERTPGSWRAMVSAGLRPLSRDVRINIAECERPAVYAELQARLANRLELARRVVETHFVTGAERSAVDQLITLAAKSVSRIELTYSLTAFNTTRTVGPKSVLAHFDQTAKTLYVRVGAEQEPVSWSAVARELCYFLYPESDAAQLAAGLKDVLSAGSVGEASVVLDELGYARIASEASANVQAPQTVEFQGDITGHSAIPLPPEQGPEIGGAAKSVNEGSVSLLRGGAPGQTLPPRPLERARRRLRSYVMPAGTIPQRQMEPGEYQRRDALGQRGVDAVLRYEVDHNRSAKDLNIEDPNHPGCDIESTEPSGLKRYIEVKAISGTWDSDGPAGLTAVQFKEAQIMGDQFWLYVVEDASTDNPSVIRIQNPAQKADQFLFDDGWRAIADHPEEGSANGSGTDLA